MNRRDLIQHCSLAVAAALVSPRARAQAKAKPRLRTALNAYSFRDGLANGTIKYDDVIRLAADLGLDGVDLTFYWMPPDASNDYFLNLRRVAYRSGINAYSIAVRAQMCRATPEAQDAEAGGLKRWLDVAERLGARHVRVFGGAAPKGTGEEDALGWAVQNLNKCAALAAPRGLFLGVEDDGALTENSALLVRMIQQAASPTVGICLDIGNFKADAYRQVGTCLPCAVNMHLKADVNDSGKEQPVDCDRLFRLVAPVYRGYMALEYENSAAPHVSGCPR
jgi:L-ribulose-5-phosphate 3-epimerase